MIFLALIEKKMKRKKGICADNKTYGTKSYETTCQG
jgi:hypothetical protein